MLVAIAIFAIVAAVAFVLYTSAGKSYKSSQDLTEQQQGARQAFDRLVSNLRLAGFNCNPDGDPTRDDEQIEGSWDTAITSRADLDHEDPLARTIPEVDLAGPNYRVVSTGNDEIVTYVLAKPGPNGPDSLRLELDADRPRSKRSKIVTISGVALVQNDPPYTLYRVVLADIKGAFPAAPQDANSFVYEAIAQNIQSLEFEYYDSQRGKLNRSSPQDPVDDIGGSEANRQVRARIRRLGIKLVGMTRDSDPAYFDPEDTGSTKHFRKIALSTEVNPENLGKLGMKDSDITPPSGPTNVRLVAGHCHGVVVKWDTPAEDDGVASYRLTYWPKSSPSNIGTVTSNYPQIVFGTLDRHGHAYARGLTNGMTYCFQVMAQDASGNGSDWAPASSPCIQVGDASTPGVPKEVLASGGKPHTELDSQIKLTWQDLRSNANVVEGDPDLIDGATLMRDSGGYKLYRDSTLGFVPKDGLNLLATLPAGVTEYIDQKIVNCESYHYKLIAVDECGVEGAASDVAVGRSESRTAPSAPIALNAERTVATRNTVGENVARVALSWNAVTTNTAGQTIAIEDYRVYRDTSLVTKPLTTLVMTGFPLLGTARGATSFTDILDRADLSDLLRGWYFYYTVAAVDACGNEGPKSEPVEVSCDFSGSLLPIPGNATRNGGIVPIALLVKGTDVYARARIWVVHPENPDQPVYDRASFTFPFSFPAWDTRTAGPGKYTIHWEIENQRACARRWTTTLTIDLRVESLLGSPTLRAASEEHHQRIVWDIINTSGRDLEIRRMDVTWTSVMGSHGLLGFEYQRRKTEGTFQSVTSGSAPIDFSDAPLVLPATMNGLCDNESCKASMSLTWDTPVRNAYDSGETISITYSIHGESGPGGEAKIEIGPDLIIRQVDSAR